jgi:hypothetical protein
MSGLLGHIISVNFIQMFNHKPNRNEISSVQSKKIEKRGKKCHVQTEIKVNLLINYLTLLHQIKFLWFFSY